MDLEIVWFGLVAVLFVGFFFLEGFDYGVGILLPFLGRADRERRSLINTIGPFWDANEVWLITAGGAIFAAFPEWYATLFSGFYLALFLLLIALIARAAAFEFRSKHDDPRWRRTWDWLLFAGSFVPALLWGIAMGNLIRGVRIDAEMHYVGSFFDLLNWYALLTGLATLSVFALHGAVFLSLRTSDVLEARAHRAAELLWIPATVLTAAVTVAAYFETDMIQRLGVNPGIVPLSGGAALLLVRYFLGRKQNGWAFVMTGLNIIFSVITIFVVLYPRVMISNLNPEWSLTIYNASSSQYTLRIMSILALILVPVVLGYQFWSYRTFWQRITSESHLEY
jgi:cytochrome d ubiquinol oxidase subunit II